MTVTPLHAANPGIFTGAGNWTYLIPGPRPVLIDAGSPLGWQAPEGAPHQERAQEALQALVREVATSA